LVVVAVLVVAELDIPDLHDHSTKLSCQLTIPSEHLQGLHCNRMAVLLWLVQYWNP